MHPWRSAITLFLATLLVGCDDEDVLSRFCTEIGCVEGLLVRFDEPPPSGTRIQLVADDGS